MPARVFPAAPAAAELLVGPEAVDRVLASTNGPTPPPVRNDEADPPS